MLLNAKDSCLILVDVQEKLIPLIHQSEQLITNCRWMMQVAQRLQIPVLISEQYPKGLGLTIQPLRELVTDLNDYMEKIHFSCAADTTCLKKINATQRQQIVLIGIEAHVCVLQTALDLKKQGKAVFVVANAIHSRQPRDAELAIARMRDAGVVIISKEMALFEWLQKAGSDLFKQLSKEFLR